MQCAIAVVVIAYRTVKQVILEQAVHGLCLSLFYPS